MERLNDGVLVKTERAGADCNINRTAIQGFRPV